MPHFAHFRGTNVPPGMGTHVSPPKICGTSDLFIYRLLVYVELL